MPSKKSKKKTSAGANRGFATTSTPAKSKVDPVQAADDLSSIDKDQASPTLDPTLDKSNTKESQAEEERKLEEIIKNTAIVESGTKLYHKLTTENEVNFRSRKSCILLSLPEKSIERILAISGSQYAQESPSQSNEMEQLKCLFAEDLLLRDMGISEAKIQSVLTECRDVIQADGPLKHIALTMDENIDYENKRASIHEKPEEDMPVSPPIQVNQRSRMPELLSDEEDQDTIEEDPNGSFVANRLEILKLQSRMKREPALEARIARLLKRSAVIETQLDFDRNYTSAEVKRQVQNGVLRQCANESSHEARDESLVDQQNLESLSEDTSDNPGEEWISIGQGTEFKNVDNSMVALASQESTSSTEIVSKNDLVEVAHGDESLKNDLDDQEIVPSDFFESFGRNAVATSTDDQQAVNSPRLITFELTLPKSSQNISPVKLLQTFLKRVDKAATEHFEPQTSTLTIRFSSAKVSRRKIMIDGRSYLFPDVETARNYLSMKALFSVPELGAEKAGGRFSGPFRQAWKMLEDEDEHLRTEAIASKVQRVRDINSARGLINFPTTNTQDISHVLPADKGTKHARFGTSERSTQVILDQWNALQTSAQYKNMLKHRNDLPIATYRDALLNAISENQVTILCGETGCGKSTQLPTFILEGALNRGGTCKIYVTEPRRISAISLANRVSSEIGESKKAISNGESLLGFSIRLDSRVSDKSRLIYATTGIVLRMLEDNSKLDGITHLILDEVHERSIESDFLLIVVKRLMHRRRDLRIVLMSATLDSERFNNYFGGHCCIFNVPGRTFPVEQYFLEDAIEQSGYICEDNSFYVKRGSTMSLDSTWELPEEQEEDGSSVEDLTTYSERTIRAMKLLDPYKINYDLICLLLNFIETELDHSLSRAVLIFLPGMGEIRRLLDTLQTHKSFGNERKWLLYPLHSSIPSEKQQAAFDIPPKGMRKIVLATNIAETGITIPDITCVIDAGKHKESRFDARRQLNKLIETFVSKANARQRLGRAGRVQPGICFHLFSKARYERMAEHQLPEFQRLNLDELALRVKTVQMGGIEDVLLEALDAPSPENVKRSINNLIEVGALDNQHDLTVLGKHLAKLPVDITLGKLILYGVRYSCLDPCLVIAASLSSKSPFDSPLDRAREAANAKQTFVRSDSDFITVWTAYSKWRSVCQSNPQHEYKFCKDSFLNSKNLAAIEELRLQYLKILVESRLLACSDHDKHAIQRARFSSSRDGFTILPSHLCANESVPTFIELCLASAFYPNLINVEDDFRTVAKGQAVTIHPSSINHHNPNFNKRWVTFFGLLKTKTATNAHDTGLVDDYIVALFCGLHAEVHPYSGIMSIDRNRIKFMTRDLRTLMALALLRENLAAQFGSFLEGQSVQDEWLEVLQEIVQNFEAVAKQRLR